MTDHDDVLKDLDAALKVEPSRAFADGVRARVNRSRVNTTRMWWGFAAAASVGLATMALWRPLVEAPVKVAVAPTQVSAPVVPSQVPEGVVAMDPATTPAVTRREAASVRVSGATVASEPRLVVITNQGEVLRAMWASSQGRPVGIAHEASVVESPATKPIEIDPIAVPPIVVSEIGNTAGSGGATPVIRRAMATKETR